MEIIFNKLIKITYLMYFYYEIKISPSLDFKICKIDQQHIEDSPESLNAIFGHNVGKEVYVHLPIKDQTVVCIQNAPKETIVN